MDDMELEKVFIEQFDMMSLDDSVVEEITPWKRSMKYIFSGLILMVMNIVLFIDVTTITKMCGYLLLLLGFRNLKKENTFFKIGFIVAIVLNVQMILFTLLEMSIWKENIWTLSLELNFIISFVEHMLIYICVWLGIWKVESKVGEGKRSKSTALLPISYGIMGILAIMNTTGVLAFICIALYICLIVEVYKVYKNLESSGYVIKPSSIKISNGVIVISMVVTFIIGIFVVSSFNKYPMEWNPYVTEQTTDVEEMKKKLISQGVQEKVLNDLPKEEIEKCASASAVVVSDSEINANDSADTKLLKMMSYAFCLDEKTSRWKILHYFIWEDEPSFYGTEVISYGSNEIKQAENISGYIMYDEEDVTYKAPYYHTDYVNVIEGWEYSNFFTSFSFDKKGSNYRGYFTYEQVEGEMNAVDLDITMDYFHQHWIVNFPAQTAWEYGEIETGTMIYIDKWEKFSKIRNSISVKAENK